MSNKPKKDTWYYLVQRNLNIENVCAGTNQLLKDSFNVGDVLRAREKLPSWLTTERPGHIANLKLIENGNGSEKAFDIELPLYLLRAKY